jgi:hypothetical protein
MVTGPTGPAGAGGGGSFSWANVPSGATGTASAGSLAYDSLYLYIAVAANTWKRTLLTAWGYFAIPTMTSANAPSGVASASSVLNSGLEAWQAFDKTTVSETTFYASGNAGAPQWLQYDFVSAKSDINGYSLSNRTASPYHLAPTQDAQGQAPSEWTFAGSDDGVTFTTLDTRSTVTWDSQGMTKTYTLSAPASYRMYRWTWTQVPVSNVVSITKAQVNA